MKYVPFSPLISYIRIVYRNRGISVKSISHTIPWLVKTILLEPLRWTELLRYEKKIKEHNLNVNPIFILGHYRSGTTYLQRLFMQCDGFGYMSIFQSALPEIMLSWEGWVTPVLQKLSSFFKLKNDFHRMAFEWNFPGEDDVGHAALLNRRGAQWGMLFPEQFFFYFDKYILFDGITEREKSDWIKNYQYLLKKLSLANSGRQLVLKSPPNTARIKLLLELFPDARFIFIHRNPFDVYASSERFWKVVLSKYVLGASESVQVKEIIQLQYEKMMDNYLTQKHLIPKGRLAEIAYDCLVKEPVYVMETIFTELGLAEFSQYKQVLSDFAIREKEHQALKHSLTCEQQKNISKRWRKYFDEWNYEPSIAHA
jgi:hypothetical protein